MILRLLQIEYKKLVSNRASKVLVIIYFALLASIAFIAAIKFNFGVIKFHLAEQGIFNFPYIWHFNTYIASILKFFLLLVIVSMMANEYSYKTLKQNLIDGLSKKEFVLSKFYMVIAISLLSTLFVFVVSMILGLIYSDFREASIIFKDLDYLLAFFVKLVSFFSFGLFLGVLIKRSAFAVGSLVVWLIFESILKGLLYWELKPYAEKITGFFPLESMSNLIKEPFSRLSAVKMAAKQVGEEITKDFFVSYFTILIALFWTAIFIYFSYRIIKSRDL